MCCVPVIGYKTLLFPLLDDLQVTTSKKKNTHTLLNILQQSFEVGQNNNNLPNVQACWHSSQFINVWSCEESMIGWRLNDVVMSSSNHSLCFLACDSTVNTDFALCFILHSCSLRNCADGTKPTRAGLQSGLTEYILHRKQQGYCRLRSLYQIKHKEGVKRTEYSIKSRQFDHC